MTVQNNGWPEQVDEQLQFIQQSKSLRETNDLLTWVMGKQKIQALVKDENLSAICSCVINLALVNDVSGEDSCLLASAILGRLSAVARGRESIVLNRLDELFEVKPSSVEVLSESDEKYYASLAISTLSRPWLADYCIEEMVHIDVSEKARRTLLMTALTTAGSLSAFWQQNLAGYNTLKKIENNDTRYKRIRRITSSASEVIKSWENEVGESPGSALAEWCRVLMRGNKDGVDDEIFTDILDDIFIILLRIIELRFSHALLAQTYEALGRTKALLGRDLWNRVSRNSKYIEKIRTCLKETALVLARQSRTDKKIIDVLGSVYYSKSQMRPAITAHFSVAKEIEPDVKTWWEQAGSVSESQRRRQHKIGNSEDHQISSLLLNVEESKTVMDKLGRAVVPILEISDPPLAETVKKAALNYSEIALATRQLATMRKLKRMDQKGMILEYNPLQHDMLGGHELGVRLVKIIRDGVQKDFGGKIKIFVKPRVVPEE